MTHDTHKLTPEQVEQFETFGLLVRRNVFRPNELRKINEEFERRLATLREEADPKAGPLFRNWSNRNPTTPYIASLLEDPRIYVPIEQLVGEDCVPVHSNANSYLKSTPWHTDTSDRHLLMVKNVMYLQPTDSQNGALRLIPRSHRSPLHEELFAMGLDGGMGKKSRYLKESGRRGEDMPCFVFASTPGDVVTFNALIWHASFGGSEDRRTCTFNFFGNPKTDEQREAIRRHAESTRETTKYLGTVGPQYHPWWLENPDSNPRRARWINWLEQWGFIEAYNGE